MNNQKFEESFNYAFKSEFYDRSKSELLKSRLEALDLDTSDFSEEKSKEVLYNNIWKKLSLEEIKHSQLRKKLFEFSTEFGSEQTSIFLQRSLKSGWEVNLVVDGEIDNKEIELINSIENKKILEKILCHRVASFCEIFAETKNINFLMKWVFR